MLYFKAWRESHVRFLLSALTLAVLCLAFVYYQRPARSGDFQKLTYDAYIWKAIYKGYVRDLYVLLVLFLGVGGLLRERDYGTAGFTLALPVSRKHHLMARALIGLIEVGALAAVPMLLVPAGSALTGETYPWHEAWQFAVLWSICGAVIFAGAFLSSELFAGEYTAPIIAFIFLLVYSLVADVAPIERHISNLHDVMGGEDMPYFNADTGLFVRMLPGRALTIIAALSILLLVIAAIPTTRREF